MLFLSFLVALNRPWWLDNKRIFKIMLLSLLVLKALLHRLCSAHPHFANISFTGCVFANSETAQHFFFFFIIVWRYWIIIAYRLGQTIASYITDCMKTSSNQIKCLQKQQECIMEKMAVLYILSTYNWAIING